MGGLTGLVDIGAMGCSGGWLTCFGTPGSRGSLLRRPSTEPTSWLLRGTARRIEKQRWQAEKIKQETATTIPNTDYGNLNPAFCNIVLEYSLIIVFCINLNIFNWTTYFPVLHCKVFLLFL